MRRSSTVDWLENHFATDPYNGVAHYYISNTSSTAFNTVVNELIRHLVLHCETRLPWMLESVYEKLHPRAPGLDRALALLESFTACREGITYEKIWLVLDGLDGLRDAYDLRTMRKIINYLTAPHLKGCFVLMSMNNRYYKWLKEQNLLSVENHSQIPVDPKTFPHAYEEYTKLQLQRMGYDEVSPETRRNFLHRHPYSLIC